MEIWLYHYLPAYIMDLLARLSASRPKMVVYFQIKLNRKEASDRHLLTGMKTTFAIKSANFKMSPRQMKIVMQPAG
jgi:hypothetical protein